MHQWYGMYGHDEDTIFTFSQMKQKGVKPNHINCVSIMTACSHAVLVDEGELMR